MQLGMLVAIVMGFFILTSSMLYVKLGRYDKYFKEFVVFYLAAAIEFILMAAAFAYKLVSPWQ